MSKNIAVGILAHVDAGKTTLSEGILYLSGNIKKPGRVDHGDAFFDTAELERSRGITIFSKQAQLTLGGKNVTLLDTPGHVDFSAEMERTLRVLDYAVLVINGADGVQSHTATLWKLLICYRVPVFLFINKMDQEGTDRDKLMAELQKRLDERCVLFDSPYEAADDSFFDELSMCSEDMMEEFLETGEIQRSSVRRAIRDRSLFPCCFGSALKMEGVDGFIEKLGEFMEYPEYPNEFSGRVYKITRDSKGKRLTHVKITGGELRVKDFLTGKAAPSFAEVQGSGEDRKEKVDEIRIYSGEKYQSAGSAEAGTVCALTGLTKTFAGQGLGAEESFDTPILEPILTYELKLPEGCDLHKFITDLKQLEEEEPQLHVVYGGRDAGVHINVMGEIEIEILKDIILRRFGVEVGFSEGHIVYKETIADPAVGVGHFEPLKHYAEVHLLMEPLEPGSGLEFENRCSEDLLDRNWQRLIMTHLEEKKHVGVLTGAEITDMRITLIGGRAHLKHTEGGDFREATYRAVRHGLKKAESILLEPFYEFLLEVPTQSVGRAIADIQKMNGSFGTPETDGEMSVIRGTAAVSDMGNYRAEVAAYTKGLGRLFCTLKGYGPCADAEQIIEQSGYDPERDLQNPTSSVFCSHGKGVIINWDQVEQYMHVNCKLAIGDSRSGTSGGSEGQGRRDVSGDESPTYGKAASGSDDGYSEEAELKAIFDRTYGQSKKEKDRSYQKKIIRKKQITSPRYPKTINRINLEKYLLVDGYNIIFAWDELKELAKVSLDGAREQLIDILCNYQGYKGGTLIAVFDAYKVKGNPGTVMKQNNIYVVYTKTAETADQYIERTVHKIVKDCDVTVATSDNLEQMITWGDGARCLTAQRFKENVDAVNEEIREFI